MKKHRAHKKKEVVAGYSCNGRIWIENNGETFLGVGRVVLLQRVREYGSISAAARSMKMSYKHAWDLISSMNRQAPFPLVETSKGGKGGGGARVTTAGEEALTRFAALQERLANFLAEETMELPW
ncbi:molybdenum-binding protein [Desulfocapsa sulfexigens DSM 10523]|uniref:Molybdenum-binding protein n=1 Tax=Desulfocapsa sulfexigens (strain DSM 10523 / SB164P1) TaxID=1167006 RepID=M1PKU5_DESSD|nr:LysR family transcriptional regulator [Desulfocapsa sulfexigens]AGF77101.1 molybdenum-binding protein [Desulfocapsa sulfexigens DSM 10523]